MWAYFITLDPPELEKAYFWLEKAASLGNENAKKLYEESRKSHELSSNDEIFSQAAEEEFIQALKNAEKPAPVEARLDSIQPTVEGLSKNAGLSSEDKTRVQSEDAQDDMEDTDSSSDEEGAEDHIIEREFTQTAETPVLKEPELRLRILLWKWEVLSY
jgi:TPR repeat protein